jgi:hypothetical protein
MYVTIIMSLQVENHDPDSIGNNRRSSYFGDIDPQQYCHSVSSPRSHSLGLETHYRLLRNYHWTFTLLRRLLEHLAHACQGGHGDALRGVIARGKLSWLSIYLNKIIADRTSCGSI